MVSGHFILVVTTSPSDSPKLSNSKKSKNARWKKILALALAVPLVGVGSLVLYVNAMHDAKQDVALPKIEISQDPAVIARGEYLVYGPAHCAVCHTSLDVREQVLAGEKIPLTGGYSLKIPPGDYTSANLTPDKETGIGLMSAGEVARVVRHGVNRHGELLIPFMEMPNVSDEDLTAIVSFLFSQEPVSMKQEPAQWNILGKMVRTLLLEPYGTETQAPAKVTPSADKEYGDYLANDLALCRGCHTNRDMKSGAYIGEDFGGGMRIPNSKHPDRVIVVPNLTSHSTGRISRYSEDEFLKRMRSGPSHPETAMPWGPYSRMSDDDLRAIYRYLVSVPPVDNDTGSVDQPAS